MKCGFQSLSVVTALVSSGVWMSTWWCVYVIVQASAIGFPSTKSLLNQSCSLGDFHSFKHIPHVLIWNGCWPVYFENSVTRSSSWEVDLGISTWLREGLRNQVLSPFPESGAGRLPSGTTSGSRRTGHSEPPYLGCHAQWESSDLNKCAVCVSLSCPLSNSEMSDSAASPGLACAHVPPWPPWNS